MLSICKLKEDNFHTRILSRSWVVILTWNWDKSKDLLYTIRKLKFYIVIISMWWHSFTSEDTYLPWE